MKKQFLKLALFGLLSGFGYADGDFDMNRDGKVDKIRYKLYYLPFGDQKTYDEILDPAIGGYPIIQKYRNKKISENIEYTIEISGAKKYSFILKKYNKIDAKGILEDNNIWQKNITPLPKKAKGFKLRIVPKVRSYMYDLYVNYINGKFYITKISEHSGNGGCIHTLVTKFTLPKTIDIDTFDELMLEKRNTKKCLDRSGYGEKGYNLKLEAEIYDIR
jgi:hypothetical protein